MVFAQLGDRDCIIRVNGAQQFLGLTLELFQIGPDGQSADGHDDPPS
jgi:hypothetical protein